MIQLIEGNIFGSESQVIGITVNCVGAMGKGLALEAAQKYPELEQKYKKICREKLIRPGDVKIIESNGRQFMLLATKGHWRYNSKYFWVEKILLNIRKRSSEFSSLALPLLGCGNGKLKWNRVLNLMLKYLEGSNCHIEIYSNNLGSLSSLDRAYRRISKESNKCKNLE